MSLTALAWTLLYAVAVLGSVFHPGFGLFGYLLEYFQRPALHWWGDELPDLRWNFTIAVIAGATYLLRRESLARYRRETNVALVLLICQAINTTVVTQWAIVPELSWEWCIAYWKLVATFILFSGIVRTPKVLNAVILFQILGAAYWGYEAIDAERFNSRLEGVGSGDTLNSNLLAAHVLTIIPLAIVFALKKEQKWIRIVSAVSCAYILNLFVLCNSRGATLGFCAAGVAALFLVRRGMRRYVMLGAAVGAIALVLLADPQFVERQQTITSGQDSSAQTRLNLWRGSLDIVLDYPVGTGGRGYHYVSPRYIPGIEVGQDGEGRSSHNTYIQVVVDWGIQGLVLFLAFIGYTMLLLHRVRRERVTADWLYFVSLGLELGLVATLVAAFFSNRFFGESIYWICALSTALYRMTSPEEASAETPTRADVPQSAAA